MTNKKNRDVLKVDGRGILDTSTNEYIYEDAYQADEQGYDYYTIRVISNVGDSHIFIDGIDTEKRTPYVFNFKKEELFETTKEVEVKQDGYEAAEKYTLSLISDTDSVFIKDRDDKILGLQNTLLDIGYYVDGEQKSYDRNYGSGFGVLEFTLYDKQIEEEHQRSLYINVDGNDESVRLFKNGIEILLNRGKNYIEADLNTEMFILNNEGYRIKQLEVGMQGKQPERLVAMDNESLKLSFRLNGEYIINIVSEELEIELISNGKVELLDSSTRTYNINDNIDLPLIIKTGDNLNTISIVVGGEILVYDNLDSEVNGIKIPNNIFTRVGTYKMNIFPSNINEK